MEQYNLDLDLMIEIALLTDQVKRLQSRVSQLEETVIRIPDVEETIVSSTW